MRRVLLGEKGLEHLVMEKLICLQFVLLILIFFNFWLVIFRHSKIF